MRMIFRMLSIAAALLTIVGAFAFALNDTNSTLNSSDLITTTGMTSSDTIISARTGLYNPVTTDNGNPVFYIVVLSDGSIRPATAQERNAMDNSLSSPPSNSITGADVNNANVSG